MTNGLKSGTSSEPRKLAPLHLIAAVGVIVASINVVNMLTKGPPAGFVGVEAHPAVPFLLEGSAVISFLAVAPLIGWAIARIPPTSEDFVRFLLIHAALTIPVSLLVVAAMTAIRAFTLWAVGGRYWFFDQPIVPQLLFEWSKLVVAYAFAASVYWLFRSRASSENRIDIRDGASVTLLQPNEVLWVEAQGNYVEFHCIGRKHLVRGTLSSWEARLAKHGFVRVHRSRLANPIRVSSWRPTASGDFEIVFDVGLTIAGSRRHRAALEASVTA